jgi:hypothetical protein
MDLRWRNTDLLSGSALARPWTWRPTMIDARLAPYGIFLLRVALGAMFIAHALLKYLVFTMPGL